MILDEPLAQLDGPARGELFDLLRDVLDRAEAGVILATHNSSEALRLADSVAILLDARILQSGPGEEVYRFPVNLRAARMLGPASQIEGTARDARSACRCCSRGRRELDLPCEPPSRSAEPTTAGFRSPF